MTKEEIAVLGHAFFDGKTLQLKSKDTGKWLNYSHNRCPYFREGFEWRIKPLEPKTITICTFLCSYGHVQHCLFESPAYDTYRRNSDWTHIKSLDQVVEVE